MLAANLKAQSYQLEATIPFAFNVDKKACPAGEYSVNRSAGDSYSILRNSHGACSLLVANSETLEGKGSPRLVFNRYGEKYFLSEIWSDQTTGSRLAPGKLEKESRDEVRHSQIAKTTLTLESKR
jgi:hypothetical protein